MEIFRGDARKRSERDTRKKPTLLAVRAVDVMGNEIKKVFKIR